jgi:hypothetical protein
MTSALFAWLVPPALGVWAGFIYMTLPISMSVAGIHYGRKVRALR